MTRLEAIFDIIEILTKSGFTDDSRLSINYIGYKIDQKRAKEIRDSYNRNGNIDPIWIQDFGLTDLTPVNQADDNTISVNDCTFGKVTLPPVVSIRSGLLGKENLGVHSVLSASGNNEFYYRPIQRLFQLMNLRDDHAERKYSYYARVHNSYYFTPTVEKVRPFLILESPLLGYIISSEYLITGELTIGDVFDVFDAQINHNGVYYSPGQSFTAVNANFTGLGKVKYHNQKRQMTNDDEYPLSHTMMESIILKILTIDYKIEMSQINDIRNNSSDTSKILSSND